MTYKTTIQEAKVLVQKIVNSGNNDMPIFLHSSPGIGKSSIIAQIADKLDLNLVDIRLASIEATDLCGIPYVREGEQVFSTPEWFPTDPKSRGILFLDELSNANITTQQAAYRVILDREINNGKRLPEGWIVIAAGNLQSDRTGVKGIVPALANRFATHLNIIPSLTDFMVYGMSNDVDPQILGFLNFKPDYLHKFSDTNEVSWPSPRSWVAASTLKKCNFEDGELLAVLAGCVGEGVASEYQSFCKYYADLPDFDKIMAGKETYKVPKKNLGIQSAVTSSLLSLFMEHSTDAKKMKNLEKIMMQLNDESIILIYKLISAHEDINMLIDITEHTPKCYKRVAQYFE